MQRNGMDAWSSGRLLGKVRSTAVSGGRTVVQTVPATIQDALPAGSFSLDQATRVGEIRRAARDQTGRASSDDEDGTFNHDLSKALKCKGGAEFDATGSVGVSSRPKFSVSWSPLHGVSASFTETVSASASLSGTVSGAAKCTFDKTAVLAHPAELGSSRRTYSAFRSWWRSRARSTSTATRTRAGA